MLVFVVLWMVNLKVKFGVVDYEGFLLVSECS